MFDLRIFEELIKAGKAISGAVNGIRKAENGWHVTGHCGICGTQLWIRVHNIQDRLKVLAGQKCPDCDGSLHEHSIRNAD